MEDYLELWNRCLQQMHDYLKGQPRGEQLFATWFSCLVFEKYDTEKKTLVLQVPSAYVYEYLETYQLRLLTWAISSVFCKGTRLQYRIKANAYGHPVNFIADGRRCCPSFVIADARQRLEAELRKLYGDKMQWLPAYDKVADWLAGNKGRGLLCHGDSGLGKTVVCTRILPAILETNIPVITPLDMEAKADVELWLKHRAVIVDDLGQEKPILYGNKNQFFYNLCNVAEREGLLLIITTNLCTTIPRLKADCAYGKKGDFVPQLHASIEERYGVPTLDRLRAITTTVRFEGVSMRK